MEYVTMANVSVLIGSGLKVPTTSLDSLLSYNQSSVAICAGINTVSGKYALSGALTSNTYKELFSVSSGGGVLHMAALGVVDTTNRTVGLKVLVDGNTVLDAAKLMAGIADAGYGVGVFSSTGLYAASSLVSIPFKTSVSLQIKSSLSETDKVYLKYAVSY